MPQLKYKNMQNKNDEYQIYIDEDKTTHYYKNKQLHRKNGPAIVKINERQTQQVEDDNGLYTITFKPVSPKTHVVNNSDVVQIPMPGDKVRGLLETLRNNKSSIITFTKPNEVLADSPYFLDGLNYSKSEFDRIVLKEQSYNSSPKARM